MNEHVYVGQVFLAARIKAAALEHSGMIYCWGGDIYD